LAEKKAGSRVAGLARDLWVAIGITVLVFAVLEGAFIGQRAVRASLFGSDDERDAQADGHPYAGTEWYKDFLRARGSVREKFDPWRIYWSYPLSSQYLNIDSAGFRVTVQNQERPDTRAVFLLGGSAMWGYTSRDSLTIPSLIAAGLDSAGVRDVVVENMAQPGYVLGHEVATLTQELSRGRRPAVVIFFDGINDIRTTQLYKEPGRAFFEPRFKHLYERESQRGFFGSFVTPGERSKLVGRLFQALGADPWRVAPQEPAVCPRLGVYYKNMHQTALGIGATWGFPVLFVQQPIHATTRKTLTPFEKSFMGPDWHVKYTRDCAEAIDSALAPVRGTSYESYASMFDDVSESVFLDRFGHVTEVANRRIARALVKEIVARLATDSTSQKQARR
jgi:hypothetical protein